MGSLTLPQGCARAWAEPPPSLWTAAKVPQHPAGSCFRWDCRTLIGFSAGVPGAQPEPGKPPGAGRGRGGAGAGPGSEPRQPTPSSTGWDPRGFPSNRVPRRARGGTLAAFRPSWAPGQRRAGRPPSRRTRRGAEVKVSVQPAPSLPSHGSERSRGSGAAPSRAGCSRAAPQKLRSGAGVASAGVSPFGSGISPIATSS